MPGGGAALELGLAVEGADGSAEFAAATLAAVGALLVAAKGRGVEDTASSFGVLREHATANKSVETAMARVMGPPPSVSRTGSSFVALRE